MYLQQGEENALKINPGATRAVCCLSKPLHFEVIPHKTCGEDTGKAVSDLLLKL